MILLILLRERIALHTQNIYLPARRVVENGVVTERFFKCAMVFSKQFPVFNEIYIHNEIHLTFICTILSLT